MYLDIPRLPNGVNIASWQHWSRMIPSPESRPSPQHCSSIHHVRPSNRDTDNDAVHALHHIHHSSPQWAHDAPPRLRRVPNVGPPPPLRRDPLNAPAVPRVRADPSSPARCGPDTVTSTPRPRTATSVPARSRSARPASRAVTSSSRPSCRRAFAASRTPPHLSTASSPRIPNWRATSISISSTRRTGPPRIGSDSGVRWSPHNGPARLGAWACRTMACST